VVDIGGIVDHHCLEAIVHFVDIGGIVDHHCLEAIFQILVNNMNNRLLNSDGQQFHQYQQHEQSPLNSDGQQHEQSPLNSDGHNMNNRL
jgi:hypothetical protein